MDSYTSLQEAIVKLQAESEGLHFRPTLMNLICCALTCLLIAVLLFGCTPKQPTTSQEAESWFDSGSEELSLNSQPVISELPVESATIKLVEIGMTIGDVFDLLGPPLFPVTCPALIYQSRSGEYFLIAFFLTNEMHYLPGANEMHEEKVTAIVHFEKEQSPFSDNGTYLKPEALAGKRFTGLLP